MGGGQRFVYEFQLVGHLCTRVNTSVADPDSFFMDPDPYPGIFSQSGSGSRIQGKKTHFFKGNNKILGEILLSTQKVGIFFVINQKSRYFIKQGTFVSYHF